MQLRPLIGIFALAGQLLAILGTLSLAGRFPPAALLFTLVFWALLFLFLHHRGVRVSDGLPFLPLLPLYYLTFFFHRGAPLTMDYVFGSDTARYVQEAMQYSTLPRHIGLGIFSFPLDFLDRIGEGLALNISLGREFLFLQSAMLGVTSVVLFARLIRPSGRLSWGALLTAYVFALSLAVWAFSSLFESFMPSLLFLLLALEASRDIFRNAAIRDGAALGLISTLAMTMSLENIYFLLLLPIVLLTRKSKPSLRRTAQLAGVVAAALPLGFLPLLAAARRTAGPDFYQDWAVDRAGSADTSLAENLGRFVAFHSRPSRLADPRSYVSSVFRIFVMSIRAQPGRPAMTYMWKLEEVSPFSPANLAYGALLVGLVLIAGRNSLAALRSRDAESACWLAMLAMLVILRQIFVTCYAWRASILFSLPSILALWLFVGRWLVPPDRNPHTRQQLLGMICLALLAALLLVSNLSYVLAIARAAPAL